MTLLHLSPNVITLRSLLHLRPNVITLRSLLHLRAVITFKSSTVPTFQTDLLAILSFLPVKRALSNLT